MAISAWSAIWFLPFVLPICIYIGYTDMRAMRIPNHAVLALAGVFVVLGPIVLPLPEYAWRLLHLLIVLLVGIVLNAAGAVGAGDAKFAAAAAPFIHLGDLRFLMALFAATLLGAFFAHRLGRATPLRRLAPEWQSWHEKKDFPMGLALGGTLALYLLAGTIWGR